MIIKILFCVINLMIKVEIINKEYKNKIKL